MEPSIDCILIMQSQLATETRSNASVMDTQMSDMRSNVMQALEEIATVSDSFDTQTSATAGKFVSGIEVLNVLKMDAIMHAI